ncbi:Uncharacterised protein [uncultured archaeon]|nr:Uncharacterised protein [uncultured archaeon]
MRVVDTSRPAETRPKALDTKLLETSPDIPVIIVTARTGLLGKKEAMVRGFPLEYGQRTFKDVLSSVIEGEMEDEETYMANSLKQELSYGQSIIVANGKKARLSEPVQGYLVERTETFPDQSKRRYQMLEIEVSAVQSGGYR